MDGDAEQLNAAGWRLLEVLRNQLADGQVETLLSLQRATAQAQQSARELEAAAESLTRDVTARITAAGESLVALADDVWVQLSAAATRLAQDADATVLRVHEQAEAAQQSVASTVQETVTTLDGAMDASLGRAAATSELVRSDLAQLLAGWESRDDARDQRLVERGDAMLTQAAERFAAETQRLATRDREQERVRAEEFARVLGEVVAGSGLRGRKARKRIRAAVESEQQTSVPSVAPPSPPPPPPSPPPSPPARRQPAPALLAPPDRDVSTPAPDPEEDEPWVLVVPPPESPRRPPAKPAATRSGAAKVPAKPSAKPVPAKPGATAHKRPSPAKESE